jgi:hypothetical protein
LSLAIAGQWLHRPGIKGQNGAPPWQLCPYQPGFGHGGIGNSAPGTEAHFFEPAGSGVKLYKINV